MDKCISESNAGVSRFGQALWAKTAQDGGNGYHPLLCHLLDVAAVAGLVWDHHLAAGLRVRLERALTARDARSLIVFLSGAHDVGKASPGFQKRVPRISECSGLPYSENDRDCPHGFVTAFVLKEFLGPAYSLLGQLSGGHHGVFPRSSELQLGRDSLGKQQWQNIRIK